MWDKKRQKKLKLNQENEKGIVKKKWIYGKHSRKINQTKIKYGQDKIEEEIKKLKRNKQRTYHIRKMEKKVCKNMIAWNIEEEVVEDTKKEKLIEN